MANTKKTTTKKSTDSNAAVDEVSTEVQEEKIVAKEIDLSQYVPVKNGFHGVLIYKSPRTGEIFTWEKFGDEQEMELRELKNARSSAKGFFINNWFMFDDNWVIEYLGLGQYYKNAVSIEKFDEIFTKSPAEIKKAVKEMSEGQKRSLEYRAVELIATGDIDSRKTISALESALGVELIEK